jgi:hypothetical protein
MRLRVMGTWLDMCLVRLGHSPVLDRAVACLVVGHTAKYLQCDALLRHGRRRYGEALTALRDTVAGGKTNITGEVIAATKMLMLYE